MAQVAVGVEAGGRVMRGEVVRSFSLRVGGVERGGRGIGIGIEIEIEIEGRSTDGEAEGRERSSDGSIIVGSGGRFVRVERMEDTASPASNTMEDTLSPTTVGM